MDAIYKLKRVDLKTYLQEYESHVFKGTMTLCPFHEDHNPSMSVDLKDDSWVWYCQSCKEGGTIIEYYAKRHGLEKKETIKELLKKFNLEWTGKKPKGKIVETYSYLDENERLLFQVVRMEPKGFCQRRPDGAGGWIWNIENTRRVIYRLPRVIRALKKGETIFIAEGEKDVHTLESLGLTATTNPGGAGKWLQEYSSIFPSKSEVIIIPDNDEPGLLHAENIAKQLFEKGVQVKILRLAGLREKEDIADWVELHDAADPDVLMAQLAQIANQSPSYEPPSDRLTIENKFLNSFLASVTQVTDAPEIFVLFSGIALLSGILNKFFFSFPRKTHLNLYILLLAPSTYYRKSTCTDIVSDYIYAVNPDLILPDSFTPEALFDILNKHPKGVIIWPELIQVKEFQLGSEYNKALPSLLLDIYDYKQNLKRWTRGRGLIVIEGPIVSILSAGIVSWFVDRLNELDFEGGLWTRFLFVPAPEQERKYSLPQKFILMPHIEEKLRGFDALEPKEMKLDKILPLHEAWARKHMEETLRLDTGVLQAIYHRLEVMLLKLACLLHLADNGVTEIGEVAFRDAEKIIEYLKSRLPAFSEEIKFSKADQARVRIIRFLKKRRHRHLLKGEILKGTSVETMLADKALARLIEEGVIKNFPIEPGKRGGRRGVAYQYIGGEV